MADNPYAAILGSGGDGGGRSSAGNNVYSNIFAGKGSQPSPKRKSLFGQFSELVESAPSGLGHFVAGALTDPGAGAMVGLPFGGIGALVGAGIGTVGYGIRGAATGHWDMPESEKIVKSFGETGKDIVDPERFADSVHEGTIVSKVIGDLANLSIVGSGAAKGLAAAKGGAVEEAVSAQAAANSAAKAAATEEANFAKVAKQYGEAAQAQDPLAVANMAKAQDGLNFARQQSAETSAAAQNAAQRAGSLLRTYKVAHGIATLGEQGAFAPIKPYVYAGKGLSYISKSSFKLLPDAVQQALRSSVGAPIAGLVNDVSHRVTEYRAARAMIEHGQVTAVRLADPVMRATKEMSDLLAKDGPHAEEAAIMDMVQLPHGLAGGVRKLRDAGMDDAANKLVDSIISDPELNFTREGYDLAERLSNGTLERENPELAGRMRDYQRKYRDAILEGNGERPVGLPENIPVGANERYVSNYGGTRQLSDEALAEREWNVSGTGPRPGAVRAVEQRSQAVREGLEGTLTERQTKLEKTRAKERVETAAQQKPHEALAHDYVESHRLAETVVDNMLDTAPDTIGRLIGRNVEGVPRHIIVEELRDRIFASRGKGDTGDAMGAVVSQGRWQGAGITTSARGLGSVRSAAGLSGQVEALGRVQGEAGRRAGTAEGRATREATAPTVNPRRLGRAEGEEAAAGSLMDFAYRQGRRAEGKQPEAARAAGERQAGAEGSLFGQGAREGRRMERTAKAARDVGITERQLAQLPERTARILERVSAKLENAPARYRPAIITARKGIRALEQMADEADALAPGAGDVMREAMGELPATLTDAVDQGLDPTYVVGRREEPAGVGGGPKPVLALPKMGRTGEETLRRRASTPTSAAEIGRLNVERIRRQVTNETARAMQEALGTTARIVLGENTERPPEPGNVRLYRGEPAGNENTPVGNYFHPNRGYAENMAGEGGAVYHVDVPEAVAARGAEEAVAQGETGHLLGNEHADQAKPISELPMRRDLPADAPTRGPELKAAMAERGLVPWDPRSPFEEVADRAVTPDTVFVPERVFKSFSSYWRGSARKAELAFQQFYDRPMRAWKASVLALTSRWHIGNVFGNAIQGMVGGGMDPLTYARRVREAVDLIKNHPEQIDAALLRRGLTAADILEGLENPPKTTLGAIVNKSYAINGMVDDLNRIAIWLEKRDAMTPAELIDFRRQHPELRDLTPGQLKNEAAIRLSLRAAGDFTRMTPFEKQVVRRVFPFYAWIRHITQLTYHLAVHHPVRVAWGMHLADLFGDKSEFPFLKGSLAAGGGNFWMLPKVNPFEDVKLSPTEYLSSITPAIKVPAAFAGFDVAKLAPLTRAPGSAGLDEYGREKTTGLTPAQMLYTLSQNVPQARTARLLGESIFQGGQKMRYQTGQEVHVGGKPVFTHPGVLAGGGQALSSFAGLPYPEHVDLEGLRQRALAREQSQLRARQRYAPAGGRGGRKSGGSNPYASILK